MKTLANVDQQCIEHCSDIDLCCQHADERIWDARSILARERYDRVHFSKSISFNIYFFYIFNFEIL